MRSMIPNIMYECTGRTLDYPGPPPTQIDPPEPARLPRGAPHTGIPQRACEPADGSSESSLEAPGRRLLRLHSRPTRPARGPSTPVSSRAIGGALPRMERPASTQNEHVSDWTRAKERAGSSSEAHSRDVAQLDSGPEGPQAPLEAPTQLGRRPEGSGDAKTAAGLLTG